MQSEGSIYIAGHSGLAGSAILRALQSRGYSRLIVRTHQELELTDARAVKDFFQQERPESVFLAAAKVGGIQANNTLPAEFLRENLLLQTHVLHEAQQDGLQEVTVWGSGTPRREFLHSDDLASACLFLMEHYDSPEIINIGWGQDCTIRELTEMIAKTVGYNGKLKWDDSRPDGTPRKVLDNRKLTALGWEPKISLQEGLRLTYQWYLKNH